MKYFYFAPKDNLRPVLEQNNQTHSGNVEDIDKDKHSLKKVISIKIHS